MLKEFKAFVLQGNVVMLAVAVVIGLAFQAVVKAVVADMLTPIISIFGHRSFGNLAFTVNGSKFAYGDVLNNIIAFLMVSAAVFFLVVKPYNSMSARMTKTAEVTTRSCPACLTDVPIAATRCLACTSDLPAIPPLTA